MRKDSATLPLNRDTAGGSDDEIKISMAYASNVYYNTHNQYVISFHGGIFVLRLSLSRLATAPCSLGLIFLPYLSCSPGLVLETYSSCSPSIIY